jgi:hypothetical protein
MAEHGPTLLGRLAITLAIFVIGIPAGFILIVGTYGTVLIPVIMGVLAVPVLAMQYIFWRCAFPQLLRGTLKVDDVPVNRLENPPTAP